MIFLYYAEIRSTVVSWDALFGAVKRAAWAEHLATGAFLHHFSGQSPVVGALWGRELWGVLHGRLHWSEQWRPWGLGSKLYLPPFFCGELIDFQYVPSMIFEEDHSFLGWVEDIWRHHAAKKWVGGRCGWLVFISWVYGIYTCIHCRHTRTLGHRFPIHLYGTNLLS